MSCGCEGKDGSGSIFVIRKNSMANIAEFIAKNSFLRGKNTDGQDGRIWG